MPNCKNCGSRISKFDKDVCPICGQVKPLDGVNSETIEVTSEISAYKGELSTSKVKKRWVVLVLSIFLGVFGVQFYYLKKPKFASIWLLCHLLIAAILIGIFALAMDNGLVAGSIITVSVEYVFNIGTGIYLFVKKDYKDGNGELVR